MGIETILASLLFLLVGVGSGYFIRLKMNKSEAAELKKEADAIIAKAEAEAEKMITAARTEIKRDSEEARKSTLGTADSLANEIVSKLKQPPAVAKTSLN